MRGPAGYGRYDDDASYVGCPRAPSDMTPCVARDGRLACDGPPRDNCVGCDCSPSALLGALERELGRPVSLPETRQEAADALRDLVREATEPAQPDLERAAAIAACPEPFWHETHRYCPACPWTEADEVTEQ